MKTQVQAVIDEVTTILGKSFTPYMTIALDFLTDAQVNDVMSAVAVGIKNGTISYNKDTSNMNEIVKYARSLTTNHLKKNKALNGNSDYLKKDRIISTTATINYDLVTPELKEYLQRKLAISSEGIK